MKTLKRNNVNDVALVSLLLTLNVFTPFLVFLFLTLSFYLFTETEDLWVKVINEIIRFFFFLRLRFSGFFENNTYDVFQTFADYLYERLDQRLGSYYHMGLGIQERSK